MHLDRFGIGNHSLEAAAESDAENAPGRLCWGERVRWKLVALSGAATLAKCAGSAARTTMMAAEIVCEAI